ncbi:MAG: hypothetical protein ACREBG_19570 [Pyrinomonadaceae bacterium]
MANDDAPHGFVYVSQLDGGDAQIREYVKAAADATLLGRFDLVDVTGAQDVVARAAAGGPFVGSTLASGAASTLTNQPTIIASQRSVFEAQEDSVGGAIAAASEQLNADVVVAAATNGLSQMEVDSSTAATTATLDSRLLAIAPYVGNAQGTNARWFVLLNDLRYGDLKAGV